MKRIFTTDYSWKSDDSKVTIKRSKYPNWLKCIPIFYLYFPIYYLWNSFFEYAGVSEIALPINGYVFAIFIGVTFVLVIYYIRTGSQNPHVIVIEKDQVSFGKNDVVKSEGLQFIIEERYIGGRIKHNELHLFFMSDIDRHRILTIKEFCIDANDLSDLSNEISRIGYTTKVIRNKMIPENS